MSSYNVTVVSPQIVTLSENDKVLGSLITKDFNYNQTSLAENIKNLTEDSPPLTLDFCQIFSPKTSISSLIGKYLPSNYEDIIKNVSFRPTGPKCRTMPLIEGRLISYSIGKFEKIIQEASDINLEIREGKQVQVHYTGPTLSEDTLKRCCVIGGPDCSSLISTESSICNSTMSDYCSEDPSSEACMKWIIDSDIRSDTEAFEHYTKLCSKNMDPYYCDLLCHITRESKQTLLSRYCDKALNNYCNTHGEIDKRCDCISSKPFKTPEALQGPRVCWDIKCTNDPKWLTFEYLLMKRECKILSCEVTLNNIDIGSETKLEVNNSCIAGNKIKNSIEKGDNTSSQPVPILLDWKLLIFTIIFLFILVFYVRKASRNPSIPNIPMRTKR